MKTNIIAVYDRVIKQYGPLMNPRNIERVQEEFDALCKDEKTQYSKKKKTSRLRSTPSRTIQ